MQSLGVDRDLRLKSPFISESKKIELEGTMEAADGIYWHMEQIYTAMKHSRKQKHGCRERKRVAHPSQSATAKPSERVKRWASLLTRVEVCKAHNLSIV